MNKLTLALLGGAALATTSVTEAATCNPTGFFIGLNGGVQTGQAKLNHTNNFAIGAFLNHFGTFAGKTADPVFELMTGYNRLYGHWLIGIHIYVGWNDASYSRSKGNQVNINEILRFKLKRGAKWFGGVGVRLGYLISPRTILSFLFNVEYNRWKVTATHINIPDGIEGAPIFRRSNSKGMIQFAPAIELKTFITKTISVNLRHKCVFGRDVKLVIAPATALGNTNNIQGTVTEGRIRDYQTTIGISMKIGS